MPAMPVQETTPAPLPRGSGMQTCHKDSSHTWWKPHPQACLLPTCSVQIQAVCVNTCLLHISYEGSPIPIPIFLRKLNQKDVEERERGTTRWLQHGSGPLGDVINTVGGKENVSLSRVLPFSECVCFACSLCPQTALRLKTQSHFTGSCFHGAPSPLCTEKPNVKNPTKKNTKNVDSMQWITREKAPVGETGLLCFTWECPQPDKEVKGLWVTGRLSQAALILIPLLLLYWCQMYNPKFILANIPRNV